MRATSMCGRGVPVFLLFTVVVGAELLDVTLLEYARECARRV